MIILSSTLIAPLAGSCTISPLAHNSCPITTAGCHHRRKANAELLTIILSRDSSAKPYKQHKTKCDSRFRCDMYVNRCTELIGGLGLEDSSFSLVLVEARPCETGLFAWGGGSDNLISYHCVANCRKDTT